MLKTLFSHSVYIKVHKNSFMAKNLTTHSAWQSLNAETAFTTSRLLVGNFTAAEKTLKTLLQSLLPKTFIRKKAQVVIQPMTMVEGGLSEVEQRVFTELTLAAGAHSVTIHVGLELDDDNALLLINSP